MTWTTLPTETFRSMALHVLPDDRAVEHAHGGEQRRRAVSHTVAGYRSGAAFLDRQTRLATVERLDLAFLVKTEDDGVRRWVDVEPDGIAQFADELRVVRKLKLPHAARACADARVDPRPSCPANAPPHRLGGARLGFVLRRSRRAAGKGRGDAHGTGRS